MTYIVKYMFECNPYGIIVDWMESEVYGDASDKNRPGMEVELVKFDTKEDAIAFAEFYSQNCCHTLLKANQSYDDMKANKPVEDWITIQDYELYESVRIVEIIE